MPPFHITFSILHHNVTPFGKELVTLIRHAGEAGIPLIRTGTNGYLFMGRDQPGFQRRIAELAETLAATPLYTFWISVDSSVPEIHERMRGLPGVFKGIEKVLPIFHGNGIFPSANLGITKNVILPFDPAIGVFNGAGMDDYKRGFKAFFNRVIDMGFTIANACYPMSIGENDEGNLTAVYEATADADMVRFSVDEKLMAMRALRETVLKFRSKIRIFTPLSSLRALERQHSGKAESCQPCRGGSDFFFVNAAGCDTFPCGYRGRDNLGKFWDLDLKRPPFPTTCKACDWECFRDPSELFGPFADFFSKPGKTLASLIREPSVLTMRLSDLRYYLACDLFNGRIPPDYRKLGRFSY